MKYVWLLLLAGLGGCLGDIDPEWQLDHTRIIAVRATPPHIPAGATSQLDMLVATKGAGTSTPPPDGVIVVSPMSLAGALSGTTVTAPSEDRLAAARTELGLMPGVPVPLQLAIAYGSLAATKTVFLGDAGDNPVLANVTIGGAPAPAAGQMITVPPDTDVHMSVDADDSVMLVDWLTSCGTMHDFDLHASYIHVLPDDPQSGELVVELRDNTGGVVWNVWPIAAQ
ncbi:MAG: hypothetical protein ABJE66_20575 [Deltaproteobacteria bacterium]